MNREREIEARVNAANATEGFWQQLEALEAFQDAAPADIRYLLARVRALEAALCDTYRLSINLTVQSRIESVILGEQIQNVVIAALGGVEATAAALKGGGAETGISEIMEDAK